MRHTQEKYSPSRRAGALTSRKYPWCSLMARCLCAAHCACRMALPMAWWWMAAWWLGRWPDGCGVRHITVETDLHHRRKGYAVACLQALARSESAPLLYLCDSRNAASAATACAAGFVLIDTLEGMPE